MNEVTTSDLTSPGGQPASEPALRVLEVFSAAAGLEFDRTLATRILGEAQRVIPDDSVQAWPRRLVEVGESLNLRLLSVECTLAEALAFVSQGKPVTTSEPAADGSDEWVLLVESRGRRVRLASVDTTRPDRWVSLAELRRRLGRSARRNWVVGQPGWPASTRIRTRTTMPPGTVLLRWLGCSDWSAPTGRISELSWSSRWLSAF